MLQRTLADLQGRQARLVRTLEERDDPGGTLFAQVARRLGELDHEQQAKLAELRALVARRPEADAQAVDLLELLPKLTPERLAVAPEPLLRTLFERFQLQVRYHKSLNRATVRVALSDDSLDGLLASVGEIEGGAARQDAAVSSTAAVSLAGGAPRRNRTGDPILTIDAPVVHDAMLHPTSPHNRAGGKALPRVGTWGSVRMRVAQFLANFWQGRLRSRRCAVVLAPTPTPSSRQPSTTSHWHLRCIALLGRFRVERRASGEASSVMARRKAG